MKKTLIILYLALISWGANAQHDHSKMDHSHMNSKMDVKSEVPSSVNVAYSQTVTAILDSYLALKDALAEDNSNKAADYGEILLKAVTKLDISSQSKSDQEELGEIIEDGKEQAEHINENSGKIEHQREHFENLTVDINDLILIIGSDRNLYQLYCPMYNNNEGGTWLSSSSVISNPYLGSKMMKCGNVQQEIIVK